MKKRIILSSIITMLLCFCMIGGATYALFTSETSVNIAVTSGKVKVEAGIENLKLYSLGVEQTNVFENGGTAVYDETTGILTLTNVTPGDKVEFDIVIENLSNIDIQYRANWKVEGKLNEVLVATANGVNFADVDWTLWEADAAEKQQTIKVAVELPVQVGNEYQEQVANIAFMVEAVQANGANVILVDGTKYDTLDAAIAAAGANGTVQFTGTVKLVGAEGTSQVKDLQGITFEGLGNSTLVFVNVDGSNSTGTCSFANINLKNLTVVDETFYTGENGENAWEFTYLEFGGTNKFENVEFTDGILLENGNSEFVACSFAGHNNDSSSYGNGTMYGAWVYSGEATFTKCSFAGTRGLKVADMYADSDVQKVVVDGCEFGPLSEKPGIAVDNRKGALELTIKNSKFVNTQAGDAADGGNGIAYVYENDNRTPKDTKIVCENNEVVANNIDKTSFKNIINSGTKNLVIDCGGANVGAASYLYFPEGSVIKNAVIEGSNRWNYPQGDVTFVGCTFKSSVYALNVDGGKGELTFIDCTFEGWVGIGSAIEKVTLENCTIKGSGTYGIFRFYQNATLTNCVIDCSNTKGTDAYPDGISAVNGAIVELNGCTIKYANYEVDGGAKILVDGSVVAE
jgi:hypothetical protein